MGREGQRLGDEGLTAASIVCDHPDRKKRASTLSPAGLPDRSQISLSARCECAKGCATSGDPLTPKNNQLIYSVLSCTANTSKADRPTPCRARRGANSEWVAKGVVSKGVAKWRCLIAPEASIIQRPPTAMPCRPPTIQRAKADLTDPGLHRLSVSLPSFSFSGRRTSPRPRGSHFGSFQFQETNSRPATTRTDIGSPS